MASQLLAMSSTHMNVSLLGADSMITNRNTFNRGAQHQKLQYCSSSSITIFPAASTRTRVIRCETMTSNTSTSNTQTNLENNNVFSRRARQDEEGASPQEMCVYEINERDRDSPVVLNLGRFGFDWTSLKPVGNLGILVPFTNKLYDGSLTQRLGITAGMCMLIRHYPEKDGDRFEATYSFYFGDYGQISVQGPYKTYEDTVLAVTGGTGIFTGVYGTVRLHQVTFPTMLFYTFKLQGIAKLPKELTRKTVPPTPNVRPTAAAVAARPHATAPHYTN